MDDEVLAAAEAELPASSEAESYALNEGGDGWEEWDEAARGFLERGADLAFRLTAEEGGEEAGVLDRYYEGIRGLQMLRVLSRAMAMVWQDEQARLRPDDADDQMHDALWRLYWIGYLVSGEITVLLRSGYATGAEARWRTLQEIYTRAYLIYRGGEDLAAAYILHEEMRERRRKRRKWEIGLVGEENEGPVLDPPDPDDPRDADLRSRYGALFFSDYGWTHNYLYAEYPSYRKDYEAGKRSRGANFTDILRMLSHGEPGSSRVMEFYYSDASAAIHGAFTSGLDRVARHNSPRVRHGPSLQGLSGVAYATCADLSNLTEVLVGAEDMRMTRLRMLLRGVSDIVAEELWASVALLHSDEDESSAAE